MVAQSLESIEMESSPARLSRPGKAKQLNQVLNVTSEVMPFAAGLVHR